MPRNVPCDYCTIDYATSRTACPHCGRPQRFPNVMAARDSRHTDALNDQYAAASQRVAGSSLDREFADLEQLASGSQAVLCARPEKLEPLMQKQFDLLPNYWDLQDLRSTGSDPNGGPDWHNLRQKAEIELVESAEHRERLHYAALSLDGTGLPHYGDCTIVLRESMIAHRATVYRTNSALDVSQTVGATLHPGGLAEWKDRGRLVTTKLADQLQPGMGKDEFQQLLLRPVKPENKGVDDVFVEVLVFGELTLYSFAAMSITIPASQPSTTAKRPVPRRIQSRYEVWKNRCAATRVDGQPVAFALRSHPNPTSAPERGVT